MPTIGDVITPTVVIDPFDVTTAAALTVIAPDGTSSAGTGEATVGEGIWIADPVPLTASGVWCLHWTITGTGEGADDQFVAVQPAGTGAVLPTPMATIADAIARLPAGKVLTADELQALPGKLSDAATKLRAFCRKRFTTASNQEIVLRPIGNYLKLPQGPVLGVDSVEAMTADGDVALDGWYWDGIDRVYLGCPWPDDGTGSWNGVAYSFRVTYDWGGDIPDLLVTKNAEIALRHLLSPSPTAGMVNEKIGQYSYLMHQGSGTPGNVVRLTDEDKQELVEAGFRRVAGTTTLTAA